MYKIKNLSRTLCFVGLCAFLASCTLPEYIALYNNTGDLIEVTFVVDDKKEVLSINSGKMQSYKIGALVDDDIINVTINGNVWSYRLVEVNSKYWSYEGVGPFSKIVFKLQIESGGKIYILPKGGDYPLKSFSDQPHGYPLTPLDE